MDYIQYIHEERILAEFLQLVSLDSESYHERTMADYLIGKLTDLGLEVTEDTAGEQLAPLSQVPDDMHTGNLYACLQGNLADADRNASEAILFSAHMDTVSPGNGKRALVHKDGTITSAGDTVLGADDAAGIAAILELLTCLEEYKLPHPDIEVVFPVAEEPYAQGSRVFDYSRLHSKKAYVLDLSGAIGTAALAAPAIVSVQITVHGKSAHAGFCPEQGISAITAAARAITALPQGHVEPDTTINFGTICGGLQRNIVPDEVIITGEIRSMDNQKIKKWEDIIRHSFEENARTLGADVFIAFEQQFTAYRIAEDEEVVVSYQQACQALQLPYTMIDTFGGSDNNHFTAHGIRGIVIANAMNDVHTKKEWSTKVDLVKSAALILKIATGL